MKNLIIVLALFIAVPAFAIIGRFGGSIDTSDPEKAFIKVKNGEASTALANGDLVSMDVTADDGVTVKLTTTAGQEVACVAAEAIAAGAYGLCQVYGYHSAVRVNGTAVNVVAGGRVAASSFAGRGDGNTASNGASIGRALDASTVSGTIPMWLKLQ